jgi:hypothetical protein
MFGESEGSKQTDPEHREITMKLNIKTLVGVVALASATLVASHLQAQVPSILTLTATKVYEGDSTDNGTLTTILAPTRRALTTKYLLDTLAQDEIAAGKYHPPDPNQKTFPVGSKLMAIVGNSQSTFQVVDKNNNLLVDVSNIISIHSGGLDDTYITSGKQNNNTGLPSPSRTIVNLLTFNFDDTKISGGAGLKFYMTGMVSGTTTDTTPNPTTKVYSETKSFRMSNAVGEGTDQGTAFLVTGSLSGSGKATLTLP